MIGYTVSMPYALYELDPVPTSTSDGYPSCSWFTSNIVLNGDTEYFSLCDAFATGACTL